MPFASLLTVIGTCMAAVLIIALLELGAACALYGIRIMRASVAVKLVSLALVGLLAVGGIVQTAVVAYRVVAPLMPSLPTLPVGSSFFRDARPPCSRLLPRW